MKYITTGTVTGVLSALAILASLFGQHALAELLADPDTATVVLQYLGMIGAVVAGFLTGVNQVKDAVAQDGNAPAANKIDDVIEKIEEVVERAPSVENTEKTTPSVEENKDIRDA